MKNHLGTVVRAEVEVDGQTSDSWSAVVDRFEDANIYQTWAYGSVRWGEGQLSHLVLHREGKILAAAQLRIVKIPVLPAGVAYVRWGPLYHRKGETTDSADALRMLECLQDEYCKRRGLILQVIPNAFPDSARGVGYVNAIDRAGLRMDCGIQSYRTVMVDLTPSVEFIRKRLDQKWRNQLNGSEKQGLDLEVTDSQEAYQEFCQLYHVMLSRKQFKATVDVGEFGRIQQQLPSNQKMRVFVARKDGQAVGALVCSLLGDTAIYLLGATNDRARELKASYFLHWQAMIWLKSQGACWYDLGGIDSAANPGGYHFKSGFGGIETTQLSPVVSSNGILGDAIHRGVTWLRRKRA
jgi:hypothetical protein